MSEGEKIEPAVAVLAAIVILIGAFALGAAITKSYWSKRLCTEQLAHAATAADTIVIYRHDIRCVTS